MMPDDQAAPNVLEWALTYASYGWRVVPIKPGEKRPPMRSWQHAASKNSETIANWFRGLYRGHGVGIATGPESGVWVLDVDTHDADGLATLDELELSYGKLPPTVSAVTGSGGRHYLFRYPQLPAGAKIGTTKNIGAGLDVRGDGGQIVAYPTLHPNGLPYQWQAGCSPSEIVVADAPGWLLAMVTVDPPVEQPAKKAPSSSISGRASSASASTRPSVRSRPTPTATA